MRPILLIYSIRSALWPLPPPLKAAQRGHFRLWDSYLYCLKTSVCLSVNDVFMLALKVPTLKICIALHTFFWSMWWSLRGNAAHGIATIIIRVNFRRSHKKYAGYVSHYSRRDWCMFIGSPPPSGYLEWYGFHASISEEEHCTVIDAISSYFSSVSTSTFSLFHKVSTNTYKKDRRTLFPYITTSHF